MQNILVTGAAGGIGSAITFDLLAHGYNVIGVDNNEENLRNLQKRYDLFAQEWAKHNKDHLSDGSVRKTGSTSAKEVCGKRGPLQFTSSKRYKLEGSQGTGGSLPKLELVQVDITQTEALEALAEEFTEDTRYSHIVSLAGRALKNEWKPFWQQDLEEIKESLLVNLFGHINIIHTFLPALLNSGDTDLSVTLVSSINALSNYGLPAYSAAKSGMYGLVNALCKEFGTAGIRVNTISPGTIVTEATKAEPKDFESLKEKTALGRFATKEDIATTVRFLITNPGITGQNITVDAGQVRI